ncbi:MAG: hypothetical protein EOP05_01130 [Proteobacteria bacterium]|nr:MAG: hypothetical protein EOP05_01130 [Pseudomonadota bacterium]
MTARRVVVSVECMRNQLTRISKISGVCFAAFNLFKVALNPKNTPNALAVSDNLLKLGLFKSGVDYLRSNPLTAPLVDNPYTVSEFDLDRMIQLPTGSLGYELASVMKKDNLDPNYFRRSNPPVEGKVILDHIEQTHDIWHIVLGFDISEAGEVGILAFQFGQLRSPQAVAFMSGALMRCLLGNLTNLPPVMDAMTRGWELSKKWPPLFAVNWNEVMHEQVDTIRDQLARGLIPTSSLNH